MKNLYKEEIKDFKKIRLSLKEKFLLKKMYYKINPANIVTTMKCFYTDNSRKDSINKRRELLIIRHNDNMISIFGNILLIPLIFILGGLTELIGHFKESFFKSKRSGSYLTKSFYFEKDEKPSKGFEFFYDLAFKDSNK